MKSNPKVVLFERTPAYLHHRAMLNRRENNIIDALELMRHAVEISPDNSEYKLDLAELYCEMGCHEQSSKLLLDMLADEKGSSECYFGLALNQLGMNDVSGAVKSLRLYQHKDPRGVHADRAMQLTAELDMFNAVNRPVSRKLYRAMRIAERACEAMREDMPQKACRLFERTLALASEQYEMRALYAMALLMSDDAENACKQADLAAEGFPPSVRALCVSAQVHELLGNTARAHALIKRAEEERPDDMELRLLIYTMGEMQFDDRVSEHARLAMQDAPYDRSLLHVRAVALKKIGKSDADVGKFWTRILRIDPEDSIAQFYQAAASKNELDQYELEYAYQVPTTEYERRLQAIIAEVNQGYDHVSTVWAENPNFRSLVRWAVDSQDPRLGRACMTVLATMDSENAQSILREYLFNADISAELKLHAAMLLKLRGVEMQKLLPADANASDGVLPDAEGLITCIPVGERQLVRYADEILERDYGIYAMSALTLMWVAYRKTRGTHTDPLVRIEAASAALAYNYLLMHGEFPEIDALANSFGCTPRQMVFYAQRIAGRLDKFWRNTKDENL